MRVVFSALILGAFAVGSAEVSASSVDFSSYIVPVVSGVSKFEVPALEERGLSLFLDYEWDGGDYLFVRSYLSAGVNAYSEKEYVLRFEGDVIKRIESMGHISESFPGASVVSTQQIPRRLVEGQLVANYGRYNDDVGVTTFESSGGVFYSDCITLDLHEVGRDNTRVSTYCKGVGLVSQADTNHDSNDFSMHSFSPAEMAGLDDAWALQCPDELEKWAGVNLSSPEERSEVCGCVIDNTREQVDALVEYRDSLSPLGNGSFAMHFITAAEECAS